MKEIKIILISKKFEKSYLYYEIDFGQYYLFVNIKKHNRILKNIIRKARLYTGKRLYLKMLDLYL